MITDVWPKADGPYQRIKQVRVILARTMQEIIFRPGEEEVLLVGIQKVERRSLLRIQRVTESFFTTYAWMLDSADSNTRESAHWALFTGPSAIEFDITDLDDTHLHLDWQDQGQSVCLLSTLARYRW